MILFLLIYFSVYNLLHRHGSGAWGPPLRFLVRSEVTVIDLVHGAPVRAAG